jgi:hypothetical protein
MTARPARRRDRRRDEWSGRGRYDLGLEKRIA